MKTKTTFVPKALQQVWNWKSTIYERHKCAPTRGEFTK